MDFNRRRMARLVGGAAFGSALRSLIADDCIPALADLDGDGILDMLTGGLNGKLFTLRGSTPIPTVLVDRSQGQTTFEVPLTSLLELSFPTYEADQLPPELAALPASKPGS